MQRSIWCEICWHKGEQRVVEGKPHIAVALLPQVVAVAHAAAAQILTIYEAGFSVEEKADHSPLTDADLAAHAAIVSGLSALTPALPVLSEESAEIPFEVRRQWQQYWLVDPLDGTREFIKRNGEFTVNIALIDRGAPVLGVIVVPASGVTYFAAHGVGAYKQAARAEPQQIKTRAFNEESIVVASSRSHGSDALEDFLAQFGGCQQAVMGSSLKFCLVAEGVADLYPRFGLTSEWDSAAAHCIVQQAGGQVFDLNLQPLRYNTKSSLLNPHFLVVGDCSQDWARFLAL